MSSSETIEYEFTELPLIEELGFGGYLVNGTATIAFDESGEWSVREIASDFWRERTAAERYSASPPRALFERKAVTLCRQSHPWLYGAIVDRLEKEPFKSAIDDAIAEALAEDGVAMCDPNAQHSTLNRAQQGV